MMVDKDIPEGQEWTTITVRKYLVKALERYKILDNDSLGTVIERLIMDNSTMKNRIKTLETELHHDTEYTPDDEHSLQKQALILDTLRDLSKYGITSEDILKAYVEYIRSKRGEMND